MEYGCIGEHLKHSFSKEIHNALSGYDYELKEIARDALHEFMTVHDFCAINVTIPYKELVIPYLHYIDDHAKEIGAVNTIVNKNGKLYGYNTDFYGMRMLILHAGVNLCEKKVAILGTGGTSKTANAVAKSMLAKQVLTISRSRKDGTITYDELYEKHTDIDVIINTTPLGMYPNNFSKAVDISKFSRLSGVIDAVYNPLQTPIVQDARLRGIPAEGGLYMLVAQGVRASEIFLDKKYGKETLDMIYQKLRREKENIVLIGMPSSGKSTVGKTIAEKCGRAFYDTDSLIEQNIGMTISQIILTMGEEKFRAIESEAVCEASKHTGAVIATGGGVPLKNENRTALSQNGKIYFIDRPLDCLLPTDDRPLTCTKQELEKKYYQRYHIYEQSADVKIDGNRDIKAVANAIIGDFENEKNLRD